jgi:hypothetical protein
MNAMHLDSARQWRQLAHQVERDLVRPPDCANPLEIEAPPCHFAGVVSRQTSSANVWSRGVDRACRRDAYVSDKRCTAITAASHASMLMIDIRVRDSIQIRVTFQ